MEEVVGQAVSAPLVATIGHKLGKEEALRRRKKVLSKASETLPMLSRGRALVRRPHGWLLGQEGIIVFPKAATQAHVRENRAALDLELTDEDLKDLDQGFRPPKRKVKLQSR